MKKSLPGAPLMGLDYVKLDADYDCHPTWLVFAQDVQEIAPQELGITLNLAGALEEWADQYNDKLDRSDMTVKGWASLETRDEFYRVGEVLARQLLAELEGIPVVYVCDELGTRLSLEPPT